MDITRNTDFLISLEIIHNKNIFFPAIRYYREKGIWINRIKLNCNTLVYFDLQSMHLIVLELLICWTVRFKFWHLGWNHFRHFVHLKRSPCSGILHEQSNLIWYLSSSALLRSEGFDGNGENLLFSRHCLMWGLIFSVMYDTSSGFPPNAIWTAFAISYIPQSFPFVCTSQFINLMLIVGCGECIILATLIWTAEEILCPTPLSYSFTFAVSTSSLTVVSITQCCPPDCGWVLTICMKLSTTGSKHGVAA